MWNQRQCALSRRDHLYILTPTDLKPSYHGQSCAHGGVPYGPYGPYGMVMDVGQWIQIALGSFALHQGREILHGMSAGSKSWILRGLLQVALMQQGSRCQDHPKSVAGNTFYRIVRLMGHLFYSTRETYCIHCALPGFDFTGLAQRMDPNAA